MMATRRRGFALLAVLWVIAGLSVLGLGIGLAGRQAIAAARDRNLLTRAQWRAAECAEQARAVIADALPVRGWWQLDRVVGAATSANSDCRVMLRASGARLSVNTADAETLAALFTRIGIASPTRDSLVDALLDWRDADDESRPLGAERDWYDRQGRPSPRNGPFADIRELHRVRGFEKLFALDTLLEVESSRVDLDHAPLTVIAALPGFGDEALSRVADLHAHGLAIGDLIAFAGQLSPGARRRLLERYSDLFARTTPEPDAWTLTVSATAGTPPVTAVLELRLVRAGERAAIVRRRTWIA